jgi:hypothetical protein
MGTAHCGESDCSEIGCTSTDEVCAIAKSLGIFTEPGCTSTTIGDT